MSLRNEIFWSDNASESWGKGKCPTSSASAKVFNKKGFCVQLPGIYPIRYGLILSAVGSVVWVIKGTGLYTYPQSLSSEVR
jgi:hypothetical protein